MSGNEESLYRRGYDPDFLGLPIVAPVAAGAVLSDLLRWAGGTILPYTHFSLAMSSTRHLAYWVAWNIDGGDLKKLSRAGIDFVNDPRIPDSAQIGNELYRGNRIDRGHLARRADVTWGSLGDAERANVDSFHYTNIAPQMDDFNQSSQQGLWGRLEDALYEDVRVDNLRVSVVAGPVFRDDDVEYRGVAIPREYWKVLAYRRSGILAGRAFLLTQTLDPLRTIAALDKFHVYQLSLAELEERTGLIFAPSLQSDQFAEVVNWRERDPLAAQADIRW